MSNPADHNVPHVRNADIQAGTSCPGCRETSRRRDRIITDALGASSQHDN